MAPTLSSTNLGCAFLHIITQQRQKQNIMKMNTEANLKVLMKLKLIVKKLQKGLISAANSDAEEEEEAARRNSNTNNGAKLVPKKGHFAVIAGKGEEAKRFVVELNYLSDPAFIKLLQKAEEEYGFEQQGVLAVPCRPQELQSIIGGGRRSRRRRTTEW